MRLIVMKKYEKMSSVHYSIFRELLTKLNSLEGEL